MKETNRAKSVELTRDHAKKQPIPGGKAENAQGSLS